MTRLPKRSLDFDYLRYYMNASDYPLLSQIDRPQDLRRLPLSQLPELCQELRRYQLEVLSHTPGHLGSSLGAVELTVALHYVCRTPYDRIVWDVGHQAYSHKILTGRRDRFESLRQWGGLSGFPLPSESEYDTFPAGHASNSISAALGMAIAAQLKQEERHVVAVIGDGSMTGGLAFEGLNNVSSYPNDLLIIINDNNMSIDANVGGLNKYLVDLNTSHAYNTIRYDLYRGLRQMNLINDRRKRNIQRIHNSVKSLLTQSHSSFFDGLGIRYFGPVDGHDVEHLVETLRRILPMHGPKILHLKTIKGKGYKPAEDNATVWHAPGCFNVKTGVRIKSSEEGHTVKFQEVFGETVTELASKDPRIVGITPAMPSGSSLNVMMRTYPDRSYDVGIAEGHAVTFSAGLAREGLIPYCVIYSSFLQRAYDQIIHDVALPNYHVVLCIDRAGLVGQDGATHQGAFDLAYLSSIPNMTVSAPMNEHYLRHLMRTAYEGLDGPMAIRYPRGDGSLINWRCPAEILPIGKGRVLHEGGRIALLSIGTIGVTADEVRERLLAEGIEIAHYDLIFAKPLDEGLITTALDRYEGIATLEEGSLIGGVGERIASLAMRHRFQGRMIHFGIPDEFIEQGTVSQQKQYCGLDTDTIYNRIKAELLCG